MARIRGPLFSEDAAGNFASGIIQFRGGLRGTHAYRPAPPDTVNKSVATDAQQTIRTAYHNTANAWRALTNDQRKEWETLATTQPTPMSGWNLYLKQHLAEHLTTSQARITTTGKFRITTTGEYRIYGE
ncbi:MAG: hypothetical protein RKO24_12925 [Candidatus Competibacter sp.]|nr:hypothetical protein [Candidatus Competibacter sp.]